MAAGMGAGQGTCATMVPASSMDCTVTRSSLTEQRAAITGPLPFTGAALDSGTLPAASASVPGWAPGGGVLVPLPGVGCGCVVLASGCATFTIGRGPIAGDSVVLADGCAVLLDVWVTLAAGGCVELAAPLAWGVQADSATAMSASAVRR